MTHVLVTGASGGIGAAICKALALRGVTVVLHYHSDRAAAEATRQAMKGGGHSIIQGDLGNPTSIECLWQEASALQRVDAVVNNAGIYPHHPPLTTDYADWAGAWQSRTAEGSSTSRPAVLFGESPRRPAMPQARPVSMRLANRWQKRWHRRAS